MFLALHTYKPEIIRKMNGNFVSFCCLAIPNPVVGQFNYQHLHFQGSINCLDKLVLMNELTESIIMPMFQNTIITVSGSNSVSFTITSQTGNYFFLIFWSRMEEKSKSKLLLDKMAQTSCSIFFNTKANQEGLADEEEKGE